MRTSNLLPLIGLWTAAEAKAPRFLTNTTREFVVNGTGIPDVDFDVGESYAGQLPIGENATETDNLYFWFFPTANEEHQDTKEIVIWLNGGAGTQKPVKNPWSWHQWTNVVWVDQPITVGFSQGNVTAKDEDDVAKQFLGFWKNFVDTFQLQNWKVYVAAESYGGFYGPYISSHMVDANDTQYYDIGGLMVVDGVISNQVVQFNVPIASYVEQYHELMPLDEPVMQKMHNTSKSCGFDDWITKYLTFPPAGPAPNKPPGVELYENGTVVSDDMCNGLVDEINDRMMDINPCFDHENIRNFCPKTFNPVPEKADKEPYFNRTDVKQAINAPLSVNWSLCIESSVFDTPDGLDPSTPSTVYALPNAIDKTKNVVIAQGAMDFNVPLNGVLLGIQNMTWGGKLGFQKAPSDPFYVPRYKPASMSNSNGTEEDFDGYGAAVPAGAGVMGTTHSERGLTLVVTQLAGHEVPGFAPAASIRQLEKLLGRIDSMSSQEPFTLPQLRNVTQPKTDFGNGTVKIPCIKKGC